jgi:hypothetical protein
LLDGLGLVAGGPVVGSDFEIHKPANFGVFGEVLETFCVENIERVRIFVEFCLVDC